MWRGTPRLHPRPGESSLCDSSLGGPLYWPAGASGRTAACTRLLRFAVREIGAEGQRAIDLRARVSERSITMTERQPHRTAHHAIGLQVQASRRPDPAPIVCGEAAERAARERRSSHVIDPAEPWSHVCLVVADVEGNGARPPGLVELAIVPVVGEQVGEVATWLVKPEVPITWHAARVRVITYNDVSDLKPLSAVEQDIRAHLGRDVLVAHNAHVDIDMLVRYLPGWALAAVIGTLKLFRSVHPSSPATRSLP